MKSARKAVFKYRRIWQDSRDGEEQIAAALALAATPEISEYWALRVLVREYLARIAVIYPDYTPPLIPFLSQKERGEDRVKDHIKWCAARYRKAREYAASIMTRKYIDTPDPWCAAIVALSCECTYLDGRIKARRKRRRTRGR